MIFHNIEKFESAVCLCLVHERLRAVGEQCVNESILDQVGPWAGKRIACLGEYTNDDDFPPQLQSDMAAWKAATATSEYDDVAYFFQYYSSSPACSGLDDIVSRLYRLEFDFRRRFSKADRGYFTRLRERISDFCDTERHRANNEDCVLCNLSTGEYIDIRAVEAFNERLPIETAIDGYRDVTINQVILSKICWSSDYSCSMAVEDGLLNRGPWTGDRFEITTKDRIKEGLNWKDVTAESLKLVEELWKREFA